MVLMTAPRYEGFFPGQAVIEGYGAGGFRFAGMSHRGSILVLPSGISAWRVDDMKALDVASLQPLFDELAGSVEFLLIGTGRSIVPVPAAVRERLKRHSIRFDPMATGHAVSTYNILLEERRKVAAALIAAP
jgi:uncharacterized protein